MFSRESLFEVYPKYYRNSITKVSNKGYIAIVTFWTKKEVIVNKLTDDNKQKILTVGNCYTTKGLKYIIQNALLCPYCTHYVFTGKDTNNVANDIFNVTFDITAEGYDKNPSSTFWEYLKHHHTFCSIDELNDVINVIDDVLPSERFIDRPYNILEEVPKDMPTFDSERQGIVIRDDDLYRLWRKALTKVKLFGTIKGSDNDSHQRELLGLVSVLTSEGDVKVNPKMPNVDILDEYIPKVCSSVCTDETSYTYGSRLHADGQLEHCINELSTNIWSRRCVSVTYRPTVDVLSPYPPCLMLIDFKVQQDKLYMCCYFRSHDIYNAYCMNIIALRQLQKNIINAINERRGNDDVSLGYMMIVSNSAHVYERDFDKLGDNFNIELDCNLDKRGYFIISINDNRDALCVRLMNHEDECVKEWSSNSVHTLMDSIQPYISEVSHALYLGKELYRAKQCMLNGKEFIQK